MPEKPPAPSDLTLALPGPYPLDALDIWPAVVLDDARDLARTDPKLASALANSLEAAQPRILHVVTERPYREREHHPDEALEPDRLALREAALGLIGLVNRSWERAAFAAARKIASDLLDKANS